MTGGAPEIALASPAATEALAARLASVAQPSDVIALSGGLGAGKTTFARGFIHACAEVDGKAPEDTPSPTFTLVQVYEFAAFSVYHFDLYRIEEPGEVLELGIEDAFADGVSLIEWPDRMGPYLPGDRLDIELLAGSGPGERRVRLVARGNWAQRHGGVLGDG